MCCEQLYLSDKINKAQESFISFPSPRAGACNFAADITMISVGDVFLGEEWMSEGTNPTGFGIQQVLITFQSFLLKPLSPSSFRLCCKRFNTAPNRGLSPGKLLSIDRCLHPQLDCNWACTDYLVFDGD
jgi:hypothetical protein